MTIRLRTLALSTLAASSLVFTACGKSTPQTSDTLVTDVSHTVVKRQSIGNCWLYATVGWVESLRKRYNGEEQNISASLTNARFVNNMLLFDRLRKIGEAMPGADISGFTSAP